MTIHTLKIKGKEVIIEEPIGYDKMKTTISRGDYHGISAEVSVGTLEFTGEAAAIITTAYNDNIDNEVTYQVKTQSGMELFNGKVDLSTYAKHEGDYCSVSCKVGEIGVKTKFNNRTSTEVDLNATTDVDGNPLANTYAWKKAKIPARDIIYKNEYKPAKDIIWDKDTATPRGEEGAYQLADDVFYQWINVPIASAVTLNEFGSCEPNAYIPKLGTKADNSAEILNNNGEYCGMAFSKGDGFDDKFGASSTYDVQGHLKITLTAGGELFENRAAGGIREFEVRLAIINGETTIKNAYLATTSGTIACTEIVSFNDGDADKGYIKYDKQHEYTFELDIDEKGLTHQALYVGFVMRNRNYYDDGVAVHNYYNSMTLMTAKVHAESYLNITLSSKQEESNHQVEMLPVHEALCKTAELISGLTVKSDYYGRMDSSVHPTQTPAPYSTDAAKFLSSFGPGSLKAITNGYKIRNLYTDGEEERNMVVSFKKLIESLDAQDCIGWGFETEGETTIVRVEPWDYFYKDDIILKIDDPTTKDRSVNTAAIISELTIGYKKYTTNEDLNSVDSVHGERTFTGGVTAVNAAKSKLCDFVADNYAIELTRRQGLKKTTEEYKYDETNFIFELVAQRHKSVTTATYTISSSWLAGATTLSNPKQLLNAIMSPRRMAERWRMFLFQTNTKADMLMTSGTINYKANYNTKQMDGTAASSSTVTFRLRDPFKEKGNGSYIKEDRPIANTRCKMKAETLKLDYPVTLAQYQKILANPMGLVVVDGEPCWIKKFTYDFNEGLGEFELIPKYQ